MQVVKHNPFRELDDMLDRFNRVFHRPVARRYEGDSDMAAVEWTPSANISETKKEYLIKADLPEVKKEDVEVTVDQGLITIKGERRLENEEKDETHHRVESFFGSFSRTFSLPDDADDSGIEADSKDGVLRVRIPKTEVSKGKPVQISVR